MARTATSSPTQQLSLLQTVVIVIAVWGLVSMPITYTGGASLPHPHSLVQFLREAETGSMSHHRIQAAGSATGHTAMAHASPQQKPVDESVDHAPVISPPSFGVERVVLASVSQPALAASIFVLVSAIMLAAMRLTGRVISPLIPPPRWVAVA